MMKIWKINAYKNSFSSYKHEDNNSNWKIKIKSTEVADGKIVLLIILFLYVRGMFNLIQIFSRCEESCC